MTDTILILSDAPDGEALLARRTKSGVDTTRGDVDALRAMLVSPYSVILPGQRIRGFLTDVPEKIRGAERLNVARFAHEDRIANNPDGLHMIVGSGDPAPTLVVDRAVMDAVTTRLDPHGIYADFDALSDLAGGTVRLLDRIVTPGPQGNAVDPDWSDGTETVYDDNTLTGAVFARLDGEGALNLRGGAYRRRTQWQAGPWAKVAAVALICGILGLALSLTHISATSAQAAAMKSRAQQIYARVTGEAAPDNIIRAVAQRTPTSGNPEIFLQLSDRLFAAMSDHPDIRVERLSFESRENSLRLRLVYPDFEAAGALERTVAASGATFVTGGVREQGGRFIGDATLVLDGVS